MVKPGKKVDPQHLICADWDPHPDFAELLHRMQAIREQRMAVDAVFYRFVEPIWSGEADRLSGRGAQQFGGRWNPVGLSTVYGSSTPRGATDETFGQLSRYGFEPQHLTPRIIFAFRARVEAVVDLTQGVVRQRLGVSEKRMLDCDWRCSRHERQEALTQAIGRAAAGAGFEGMFVPSVASDDAVNLVLFPEFLRSGSRLETVNAHKLKH